MGADWVAKYTRLGRFTPVSRGFCGDISDGRRLLGRGLGFAPDKAWPGVGPLEGVPSRDAVVWRETLAIPLMSRIFPPGSAVLRSRTLGQRERRELMPGLLAHSRWDAPSQPTPVGASVQTSGGGLRAP